MESTGNLKKQAVAGVLWKGLERVFAQLVSTIVAIILARILVPEDYSVVSIVLIFFAFCNIFISGGLNTALIQKKNADTIDYSTIFLSNMVMASILYIIMFVCAPYLSNFFAKPILTPVIRVMSISFFINGYKAILSAKVSSDLRFKNFFWSTIGGTIISAIVGIVMAIKGYGAWALVAQQLSNIFVDSVILTFTTRLKFKLIFSWKRFKSLFKYGGKIMLSSVINQLYEQMNPLIVGIRYSAVDLAYYNKGKTYPDMIASLGDDTLSSTLFPAISKVQDDKQKVLSFVRRFMQMSSFVIFPLMIGFLVVSNNFVKIVLTEKWIAIVPYLMIFCVSNMMRPIQSGNLQAIRAIGRSDVFLLLEIIKKSLYTIVILIFVFCTHSPVLLAVTSIINSFLASVINTFPNRKLLGYGYKKQFSDLFLNLITAIIMGIVVYAMNYIPINIYLLFILQIIVGVMLYLGINVLISNKSLTYFIDVIKQFLPSNRNDAINKKENMVQKDK